MGALKPVSIMAEFILMMKVNLPDSLEIGCRGAGMTYSPVQIVEIGPLPPITNLVFATDSPEDGVLPENVGLRRHKRDDLF